MSRNKKPRNLAGLLMIKPNETPRIFFEKVKIEVRFNQSMRHFYPINNNNNNNVNSFGMGCLV